MLKVGAKFVSKCGNRVEITSEVQPPEVAKSQTFKAVAVDPNEKRKFRGKFYAVVEGHEIQLGKTHVYDEDGHWVTREGEQIANCIHDLKEELKDEQG